MVKQQAAPGTPIKGTAKDPDTWFGESRFTNAVQAQFGISIFLRVHLAVQASQVSEERTHP